MAKRKTGADWRDLAIAATEGSQFGAILHCALGRDKPAPCFHGKAIVTSDGFVQCNFTDSNGNARHMAFVGSAEDLARNGAGLARHLLLGSEATEELRQALQSWIATDYRSGKTGIRF